MGLDPVTLLVGLVISVGLALAAQALLKPRDKGFIQDDKPTTLAERGAYLPWLIGRRRVGAIFCWAGDRFVRKEKVSGGGKGGVLKGSPPKEPVYYESAMHALCIGPAHRLHKIWKSGAVIWEGPIDAVSHPSGSTIPLGDFSSFQIYWGEEMQPVNSYLGSGGRIVDELGDPIASRWPFICYIVWRDLRLGGIAQWPLIDYDIEVRITDTAYVAGPPWLDDSRSLSGAAIDIIAATNGVPGVCKVRVAGQKTNAFRVGAFVKIVGNAAGANGEYRVRGVTYTPAVYTHGAPKAPPTLVSADFTEVYLSFSLSGATATGTIQPLTAGESDGVNPAHAAALLLFGKPPHGLRLDPAEFDLTTLDDLSQICVDEGLSCSLIAQQGDTAEALLANLMQDFGFFIPWDVARGKYVFRAIRLEDPSKVTAMDQDLVLAPNPEILVIHGEKGTDKIIFTFADRTRNFRDMTIQHDDDAQETLLGQQRIQKIQLPSVISFEVANRVAERRAQEELAGAAAISFKFDRGSRFFVPGQVFTVPGYPGSYRVERMAIEDSLSGEVTVSAVADIWGSKPSTYENPGSGGGGEPGSIPEVDPLYTFIEVPSHVSPGTEKIIVPRVRANAQIVGADIYVSRDGAGYTRTFDDSSVYTGGTLVAQLDADTMQLLDQGPVIQVVGPDISTVLDLSGDLASWGAGRQLVVIDEEIFYLKKVTALGGGQYRLDGLMRARFDTQRATHVAGSGVFIFQDDVEQIEDSLLSPGQDLWMKPQAKTTISVSLSIVPEVVKTLDGKGITPMAIENLCAADAAAPKFIPNDAWPAGGAAVLRWAYRSTELSRSGAGLQGYGLPAGKSGVQGSFTVRIKTTGDVLKATYSSPTPDFTYSQALMVADFGAEPAAFKAEVLNVNGGLSGPSRVVTVNRI